MRWAASLALAAGCLSSPGPPIGGEDAGMPGDTAWQVALGSSLPYVAAANGDAVVVAAFNGTVELESPITAAGGGLDILVAGFDVAGTQCFAKAYGGPAEEFPTAIALSRLTGEISVVGIYGGGEASLGGGPMPASGGYSVFAARYLDHGEHEWSLPGIADSGVFPPSSISIGGAGGIALAGDYLSMLDFGGQELIHLASHDVFFAQVDQNGDVLPLIGYGGDGDQFGIGALEDGLGNFYLFGTATSPFVVGQHSPDADADGAMFVLPIDDLGRATTWMLDTVGGSVGGLHAATMPDGCLLLTGWFGGGFAFDVPDATQLDSRGGTDVFVAIIQPDGKVAWLEQLGGPGDDESLGVAVAPDGRFALSGDFHGTAQLGETELTSAGNSDVFVIAFDADRTVRWARRFGDVEDDKGMSVAMDDDGAVLLGAVYRGEVDFGGPAPLSSGGDDGGAVIRFR